ncbi:peptidylprolyl isomerase [Arsenophonus symbiont of Ornithomya chloropus]|uniref:peptidylprolyl isomerase n=1 Tax=Arsenophonus symbiont of Ornithomya chloropus TaxID=634121 RepID=UPI0032B23B5B
MLDKLRVMANSFFLKIIFIIIVVSFLFTGMGNYLISNANNYVAKVNGSIITSLQLQRLLEQEKTVLKERLGDRFYKIINNEKEMTILRHQALERLIAITLLNQYSNDLGLTISNNEIQKNIYNMAIFQTDNQFDYKKYKAFLLENNINSDDLAKEIRKKILNKQVYKMYVNDEFVLPQEIEMYTKLLLEKREIKKAILSTDKYELKQSVTDKELQDYYDTHHQQFLIPEEVKISYVKLDIALQNIPLDDIKDNELQRYYEKNISDFTEPEKRHYSMIQLITEKEADAVSKALSKGFDFNKLFDKKSTDKFSIKNYGSIGWIPVGLTPIEIINANLINKGQISEIIKLGKYYTIIRLDDIKPKIVKSFDLVKNQIKEILKNKKMIDSFHVLQEIAKNAAMNDNESLHEVEKVTGVKAIKTDWFNRNNLPAAIKFKKIADAIFDGDLLRKDKIIGVNSGIINIDNNNVFIIRIEDYKPEELKKINLVKQSIIKLVKRKKAMKLMEEEIKKILIVLNNGDDNGEVSLKKIGIVFGKSKIFDRFKQDDQLTEEIFNIEFNNQKNKPKFFLLKDKDNFVIIKLIKCIYSQPKNNEFELFSEHYKYIFGNTMMESLISNLRKKAKIHFGKVQ